MNSCGRQIKIITGMTVMSSAVVILKEIQPLMFRQNNKPPDIFTYPADQSWQLLKHQPIALVVQRWANF